MVLETTKTVVITQNKVTESETIATCPPFEFVVTDNSDQDLSVYPQFIFDQSTNTFSIYSADLTHASVTPYTMKVSVKYVSSVHTYSVAGTQTCDVLISSPCTSPVSLTAPASQTNPADYHFKGAFAGAVDSVTFTLNQFTIDPSICSITYSCDSNTGPRTDLCSLQIGTSTVTSFDTTTGVYSLTSTDYDPLQTGNPLGIQPGVYVFTITGTVGDKSASVTFTLTIIDPCLSHGNLYIQKHIFDKTMS